MAITAAPPATEEQIRQAEESLGFQLPSQYKGFLREHNGGRPFKADFDAMVGVSRFLSVGISPGSDLAEIYRNYCGRVTDGYIPIAEDGSGNLILMSIDDKDPGVYFWDHEEELEDEDGESIPSGLTEPIAPNLSEFLAGLGDPPELPEVEVLSVWANPDFLRRLRES